MLPFGLLDRWLAPAPSRARIGWLGSVHYAHRGLHDGMSSGPILENSLAALHSAIAGGYGIECDVQRTADNQAIVFHDWRLDRLTGSNGRIDAFHAAALATIGLNGDNGTIPSLGRFLDEVAGKTPLLIEIKTENARVAALCDAVGHALKGYAGSVAVMAFNPMVGAWFGANAPEIIRGLVITEEKRPGWTGDLIRHASVWKAQPDFLAYDIRDLPSRFASGQRARGLPVLSWTVRTEQQWASVKAYADAPIFERPREPQS